MTTAVRPGGERWLRGTPLGRTCQPRVGGLARRGGALKRHGARRLQPRRAFNRTRAHPHAPLRMTFGRGGRISMRPYAWCRARAMALSRRGSDQLRGAVPHPRAERMRRVLQGASSPRPWPTRHANPAPPPAGRETGPWHASRSGEHAQLNCGSNPRLIGARHTGLVLEYNSRVCPYHPARPWSALRAHQPPIPPPPPIAVRRGSPPRSRPGAWLPSPRRRGAWRAPGRE